MSDVSIFNSSTAVATGGKQELSELAKAFLGTRTVTNRRIQINTNGTFKKIVNGEQVGGAVRGEFNAVIINALPTVSRIFYKSKYDPNKEATLPNCWSNAGDKPEEAAGDKQSPSCATCPQNIKGSGENGTRACRYQRRVALLLEDELDGEVYQFNIPAKSIFGKGSGRTHPFEEYMKFIVHNRRSPDRVLTTISFDLDADTTALSFSPARELNDDEIALVKQAQTRPETSLYTKITVAQADGVKKQPEAFPTPKVARSEEPDDDPIEEPVKKEKKKAEAAPASKDKLTEVLDTWGSSD